jgi:hypothetical protein
MNSRRHLRLAAAAGSLSLLAACGTTVGGATAREASLNIGNAPTAASSSGPLGSQATSGQLNAGPAVAATGQSGAADAGIPPTGGDASAADGSPAAVNGQLGKTVPVGLVYCPRCGEGDANLGASGIAPGDAKADADALIAGLNQRGGILGRKIVPIYYERDPTIDSNTQAQSACAAWTQDHHVVAALTFYSNDVLRQCLSARRTLLISTDLSGSNDDTFRKFPSYVEASSLNVDRAATATVDGLFKQNYFGKSPKIGIVTYDAAAYHEAVTQHMIPALAAHHLQVSANDIEYVHTPETEGDLSNSEQSAASAVLKLNTDHVDHVLLLDGSAGVQTGGILTLFFMTGAQSQAYNPRYGLNSANGLTALAGDIPAQQLAGALAIGWEPTYDESSADDPDSHSTPTRKLCLSMLAAGGVNSSNRNDETIELDICDMLLFLKTVLERAGASVTAASFKATVDSLGGAYTSPLTFTTRFGSSRHDGVAAVRSAAFVDSCDCFRYTGPAYSLP